MPAVVIARSAQAISDRDMQSLMSVYIVIFSVVAFVQFGSLADIRDERLSLNKVNPISLSYVCSSFILYYVIFWRSSKRVALEAILSIPVLIPIIAMARSRGMLIATAGALAVYIILLRGSKRMLALVGLGMVGFVLGYYIFPEYLELMIGAVERIDANTDMSTAGRVVSFYGAWQQFLDDPLMGRYVTEQITSFYPHNIYLESLMAVGLLGSILFAIHLLQAMRSASGIIRQERSQKAHIFISLLFLRDAIGAAASGGIWSVSGFWITSFTLVAIWKTQRSHHSLPTEFRRAPFRTDVATPEGVGTRKTFPYI